jgi:acyl-CoA dehydrogenase
VLGYFRASRWLWTAAGAAFLVGVSLRGGLVPGWRATLWTAYVAAAAVVLIPQLRRGLISDPLLNWFRKVMPQVSQTEQEALDLTSLSLEELRSGSFKRILQNRQTSITAPREAQKFS